LVPAGWLAFMAFCKWQSGDWFAYQRVQEEAWHIGTQNPLLTVWQGLADQAPINQLRLLVAPAVVATGLAAAPRRRLPHRAFALAMIAMPLAIGDPVYKSLIRYLVVVFPVCLVLTHWARRASVDMYLTAALALTQGVVFALWFQYDFSFLV